MHINEQYSDIEFCLLCCVVDCTFVMHCSCFTIFTKLTTPPPKYFGESASLSHRYATKFQSVTMGCSKFLPENCHCLSTITTPSNTPILDRPLTTQNVTQIQPAVLPQYTSGPTDDRIGDNCVPRALMLLIVSDALIMPYHMIMILA